MIKYFIDMRPCDNLAGKQWEQKLHLQHHDYRYTICDSTQPLILSRPTIQIALIIHLRSNKSNDHVSNDDKDNRKLI